MLADESPADAIELDVQFSADEVLMVCHDRNLRRYGLGGQRIRECKAADLQDLDLGSWFHEDFSGARMPTLTEVLEHCAASMPLMLELKVRDEQDPRRTTFIEAFMAEIHHLHGPRDLFVLSFDLTVLEHVHTINEDVHCILNVKDYSKVPVNFLQDRPWLYGVDTKIRVLTEDFANQIRDAGRVCLTYTCDTEEDFQKAMALQVDVRSRTHE